MVAPLKPADIARALQRGTQPELDEYQRLLAQRFESDPSLATAEDAERDSARLERLRQLGRQLFGYC